MIFGSNALLVKSMRDFTLMEKKEEFFEALKSIAGVFQAGDVFLTCGNSDKSRSLVFSQKLLYRHVQSSHVFMVLADYVGVDANPGVGVKVRTILSLLSGAADNWRAIRLRELSAEGRDELYKRCVYYLNQPYKIKPSPYKLNENSYCSELIRKVYSDLSLVNTDIPNGWLIAPAHFDRIADDPNSYWEDVTEPAKEAVKVLRDYEPQAEAYFSIMDNGLQLNRGRFDDRRSVVNILRGVLSEKSIEELESEMMDLESNLRHNFWDVG